MEATGDINTNKVDEDASHTLVAVYNRYLIDAMLAFKTRPEVRRHIRDGGHKAVDPSSPCHLEHASAQLTDGSELRAAFVGDIGPGEVLMDARSLAFEPLKGVPLSAFVSPTDGTLSEADAQVLRAYVFVFVALAASHAEKCDVLSRQVIAALSRAQSSDKDDTDADVDGILDDDISALLDKVAACSSPQDDDDDDDDDAAGTGAAAAKSDGADPLEGVMKLLENSKIASMASEISGDIQLDPDTDPAELISFDKLTDGNSPLGKIVSQVGSKIKSKLDSGELKQDELLKEAVGFLKAFEGISSKVGSSGGSGGGGATSLMSSVMKMAGSLGGDPKGGMASALSMLSGLGGGAGLGGSHGRLSAEQRRERMRRKLAKHARTE